MKVRLTNGILLDLSANPNVKLPELDHMNMKSYQRLVKEAALLQSYYDEIKANLRGQLCND